MHVVGERWRSQRCVPPESQLKCCLGRIKVSFMPMLTLMGRSVAQARTASHLSWQAV